jgi:hypothetical protein
MVGIRRALLLAAILIGCASPAAPAKQPNRFPETAVEAESLKAGGASWSDVAVREHYLRLVARIGPANEKWKQEGLGAEERAHRAFKMRQEARVLSRTMMGDPKEVEALRERDMRRFGNPEGPTFEWLVERQKKKGVEGDAIFEAIIASAQRTDAIINELVGPSSE